MYNSLDTTSTFGGETDGQTENRNQCRTVSILTRNNKKLSYR